MKRPINQQDEMFKNAKKVAKRIAITILCCLPVLFLFSYFTRDIITQDWLEILCFMLIMGVAVAVEEVIVRKRERRKAELEILETKKDVFK